MADSKNETPVFREAKVDDGGLAFPGKRVEQVGYVSDYGFDIEGPDSPTFGDVEHPGMSLRDWFAGQALAQFIQINERVTAGRENVSYATALKVTAEQSYAVADAMIAARKGDAS